jgi:hypothetical protein
LVVEQLEFVAQLGKLGLTKTALEILNLHKYTEALCTGTEAALEREVLGLMPLRQSLSLGNAALVKIVIAAYLTIKYSSFSICLVGESKLRLSIVRALAYLLEKNAVPILISTMLDLNDLLGTYEQMAEGKTMAGEKSLFDSLFLKQQPQEEHSSQTSFVFVESKVVTSLADPRNLVYVEVPNDTIAQRIEKGLTEVYHHRQQLILGTDTLKNPASIARFVTLTLTDLPLASPLLPSTSEFFPSNESSLTHREGLIRQRETESMVLELMNQENDRAGVAAWRRVAARVVHNSQELESRNKQELRERLEQQALSKYKVRYVAEEALEQRAKRVAEWVQTVSSREEFLQKTTLQAFFTTQPDELAKRLGLLGAEEENLREVIRKFQVLFICNAGVFQQQALALLPVVLRSN